MAMDQNDVGFEHPWGYEWQPLAPGWYPTIAG